jgi:hypothetical protein
MPWSNQKYILCLVRMFSVQCCISAVFSNRWTLEHRPSSLWMRTQSVVWWPRVYNISWIYSVICFCTDSWHYNIPILCYFLYLLCLTRCSVTDYCHCKLLNSYYDFVSLYWACVVL